MSFSLELKREILENKLMRGRYKRVVAQGLFLFGHAFGEEGVSLRTESGPTALWYARLAKELLGGGIGPETRESRRSGKSLHTVALRDAADRARLVSLLGTGWDRDALLADEEAGPFLAGVYLACGNMMDPEKGYRLEFLVREGALGRELLSLLDAVIPGAKLTTRRGQSVCYYKECGAIEDLLTLIGATKSCLAVIDVETYKSVRNRANRETNCETANIDKQVDAAASQIDDIRLIYREKGKGFLSEPLQQVAELRLEHPDASLRELMNLSLEPLSRSGLYHRLDKLAKIAAELRETEGEEHG